MRGIASACFGSINTEGGGFTPKYRSIFCDLLSAMDNISQFEIERDEYDEIKHRLHIALAQYELYMPHNLQTIVKHQLSHAPEFVERFGPLRSVWMFGFERAGSVLKRSTEYATKFAELSMVKRYLLLQEVMTEMEKRKFERKSSHPQAADSFDDSNSSGIRVTAPINPGFVKVGVHFGEEAIERITTMVSHWDMINEVRKIYQESESSSILFGDWMDSLNSNSELLNDANLSEDHLQIVQNIDHAIPETFTRYNRLCVNGVEMFEYNEHRKSGQTLFEVITPNASNKAKKNFVRVEQLYGGVFFRNPKW